MESTWGPSGAGRTQMGPRLAPWALLSGILSRNTAVVDTLGQISGKVLQMKITTTKPINTEYVKLEKCQLDNMNKVAR